MGSLGFITPPQGQFGKIVSRDWTAWLWWKTERKRATHRGWDSGLADALLGTNLHEPLDEPIVLMALHQRTTPVLFSTARDSTMIPNKSRYLESTWWNGPCRVMTYNHGWPMIHSFRFFFLRKVLDFFLYNQAAFFLAFSAFSLLKKVLHSKKKPNNEICSSAVSELCSLWSRQSQLNTLGTKKNKVGKRNEKKTGEERKQNQGRRYKKINWSLRNLPPLRKKKRPKNDLKMT